MKTKFRSLLNGALISSLTLLLTYIIQPNFLIQNKPSTGSEGRTTPQAKVQEKIVEECDSSCVDRVVTNMISGENLSYRNGLAIKRLEGEKASDYLLSNPEKIAAVERTLKKLDGQDDRDSILFVFSNFPAKQIVQIAERLLSSEDKIKDKSDGLFLLTQALKKGAVIEGQLQRVIKTEQNLSIVFKAISIMSEAYPTKLEEVSLERLDHLIINADNEVNQSKALLIKVRLFTVNDNIKGDIVNALNSTSAVLREAGIRGLDSVLNGQSKGRINGTWNTDSLLKKIIEKIANNTEEKPRIRVEALNLMRRHFLS